MRAISLLFALSVSVEASAQLSVVRAPSFEGDERPTGISLVRATTYIRCWEWGAKVKCELEARYVVQNMGSETERAWLFFILPGDTPNNSHVKIYEGEALEPLADLSDELGLQLYSPTARRSENPLHLVLSMADGVSSVELFAGQRTTIIVRCGLAPIGNPDRDKNSALEGRHNELAPKWRESFYLSISPEKAKDWSIVGDISLTVEVPTRWEVTDDPSAPPYAREEDKTQTLYYQGLGPTDNFDLNFRAEHARVQGGGLLFGVGASFVEDPFVFRMGYEAGSTRPVGVLGSIALETNFHSRAAVIPQLGLGFSAAEPNQREKIPMLGFFLGVPLLVEDTTGFQVGARTQVDVTWGPIGLSMPVDLYPGNEQPLRVSLLGHLSF